MRRPTRVRCTTGLAHSLVANSLSRRAEGRAAEVLALLDRAAATPNAALREAARTIAAMPASANKRRPCPHPDADFFTLRHLHSGCQTIVSFFLD